MSALRVVIDTLGYIIIEQDHENRGPDRITVAVEEVNGLIRDLREAEAMVEAMQRGGGT